MELNLIMLLPHIYARKNVLFKLHLKHEFYYDKDWGYI